VNGTTKGKPFNCTGLTGPHLKGDSLTGDDMSGVSTDVLF
jgi:hypothetical protein